MMMHHHRWLPSVSNHRLQWSQPSSFTCRSLLSVGWVQLDMHLLQLVIRMHVSYWVYNWRFCACHPCTCLCSKVFITECSLYAFRSAAHSVKLKQSILFRICDHPMTVFHGQSYCLWGMRACTGLESPLFNLESHKGGNVSMMINPFHSQSRGL
jgi:hypothetical protein